MKDTSARIPNSARLGGSSGRIEKTVPLSAWYDPAVSLHATRSSHDSDLSMCRLLELMCCARRGKCLQVLPLYVTIGAGSLMCAYVCALKISTHPDIMCVAKQSPQRDRSSLPHNLERLSVPR